MAPRHPSADGERGAAGPRWSDATPAAVDAIADLLRAMLGDDVRVRCGPPTTGGDGLLGPERDAVSGAIGKRVLEFATGRALARRAMADLGLDPTPIPRAPDRAPVWPGGVIGSISHTHGLCAAAVARRDAIARDGVGALRSLGVDVERLRPIKPRLRELILTPAERAAVAAAPRSEQDARTLLLFGAKEALYKCQHPVTGRYLGFQDVEAELTPDLRGFRARVLAEAARAAGVRELSGRVALHEDFVIAACSMRG